MNRKTKLTATLVSIATIALLLLISLTGKPGDSSKTDATALLADNPPQASAPTDNRDSLAESGSGTISCLNEALLETHPIMMDELRRLDPYTVNMESIAAYRDLAQSELSSLIDQGDSGAMAVVGAMHEMKARGWPESYAVPYLLHEGPDQSSNSAGLPAAEEQKRHYEQAAKWFYQAALHGRVLALTYVGRQLDNMGSSPVDLGWISADEYNQLTRAERSTFNAANVYQAVAYTIAPELEIGLFDDENAGFGTAFAKRFSSIAEPIAAKYRSDRKGLGLRPLLVPASELPPAQEIAELLCRLGDE